MVGGIGGAGGLARGGGLFNSAVLYVDDVGFRDTWCSLQQVAMAATADGQATAAAPAAMAAAAGAAEELGVPVARAGRMAQAPGRTRRLGQGEEPWAGSHRRRLSLST